ncbi:hypothetical protein F5879DRAFT_231622 [Lentinula edodes]|nr:hypothetical protein F5879DRAFT_231622 [Lentinula edodes]
MVYSPSVFTVFAVGAVSCVLAAPIPAFISDSLAPTGGRSIETNPVSGNFNVVFDDTGNGVDVEQKHPEFELEIEEEEIFQPHHDHRRASFHALVPIMEFLLILFSCSFSLSVVTMMLPSLPLSWNPSLETNLLRMQSKSSRQAVYLTIQNSSRNSEKKIRDF